MLFWSLADVIISVLIVFLALSAFDVEYIYGFVRWGGLQAKPMTSQRAAFKMADMR